MSWQDIVISISNAGFIIALFPLFFSTVFGVKTIQIGLSITGFVTSFFLVLMGIAVISFGAVVGGSLIFISAVGWLIIAIAALARRNKLNVGKFIEK